MANGSQRVADDFQACKLTDLNDKIALKTLNIELPLAEIYNDVQFPPPSNDPEEDE